MFHTKGYSCGSSAPGCPTLITSTSWPWYSSLVVSRAIFTGKDSTLSLSSGPADLISLPENRQIAVRYASQAIKPSPISCLRLLIQHLVDSLDLRDLALELGSGLVPNALLGDTATLSVHERRVPIIQGQYSARSLGTVDLRGGVKVLHNISMVLLRNRHTIDKGSSTNLRLSCSKVHDQSRNQLGLVGVCERGPG